MVIEFCQYHFVDHLIDREQKEISAMNSTHEARQNGRFRWRMLYGNAKIMV